MPLKMSCWVFSSGDRLAGEYPKAKPKDVNCLQAGVLPVGVCCGAILEIKRCQAL